MWIKRREQYIIKYLMNLPGGCLTGLYTAIPRGLDIVDVTTDRAEQLNLLHMETLLAARSVQ